MQLVWSAIWKLTQRMPLFDPATPFIDFNPTA